MANPRINVDPVLVNNGSTAEVSDCSVQGDSLQDYERRSGCDSSDCTYCQSIARVPFCDNAKAEKFTQLLRKRVSQQNAWSPDCAVSDGASKASGEDATSNFSFKRLRVQQPQEDADFAHSRDSSQSSQTNGWLESTSAKTCRKAWKFQQQWSSFTRPAPAFLSETGTFSPPFNTQRSDILCALEFSYDGMLIAAGGVLKQLRLYSLSSQYTSKSAQLDDTPVVMVRMPAKISSLAWAPEREGVVTVGDYDGNVSQIHITSGHFVAETDGHAGRKVWSVAHCKLKPNLVVSTSDDRTAKLWSGSCLAEDAATITPPGSSSICGADFSATDENLLALASSDRNVYIYDLRNLQHPLLQLSRHSRPVSYVKFLGNNGVVSASTDGTLAHWHLSQPSTQGSLCNLQTQPTKLFAGHKNEKNFVGLSVRGGDGLLACGSETAQVYSYHTSWSQPLAVHTMMPPVDPVSAEEPFVSAVCWQPDEVTEGTDEPALLAAALSGGQVKLLSLSAPNPSCSSRCQDECAKPAKVTRSRLGEPQLVAPAVAGGL